MALKRDEAVALLVKAEQMRDAFKKSLDDVAAQLNKERTKVSQLKEQLLKVTVELSRLQGYMQRVESDDKANAELVKIEKRFGDNYHGPQGVEVQMVPKRELGSYNASYGQEFGEVAVGYDDYKRRIETKSWVTL